MTTERERIRITFDDDREAELTSEALTLYLQEACPGTARLSVKRIRDQIDELLGRTE